MPSIQDYIVIAVITTTLLNVFSDGQCEILFLYPSLLNSSNQGHHCHQSVTQTDRYADIRTCIYNVINKIQGDNHPCCKWDFDPILVNVEECRIQLVNNIQITPIL